SRLGSLDDGFDRTDPRSRTGDRAAHHRERPSRTRRRQPPGPRRDGERPGLAHGQARQHVRARRRHRPRGTARRCRAGGPRGPRARARVLRHRDGFERRTGKSTVALVDLDLQFGDIGIALDLKSANSLADLLNHVDSIDQQLVDEVFVKHASGVRALLAPENLASVPSIDPDRVARVVAQLRPHFQYIVCDLWSSLEDLTLATLRMAARVILVTTPELPA